MKSIVLSVFFVIAFVAIGLLWQRVHRLEGQVKILTAHHSFPLGEMMGYMQRYADKLWYAGTARNWKLAGFYHDELSETAGDIAAAHVFDEGIEVSRRLQTLLPPALVEVNRAVAARDPSQFRRSYTNLVTTCNACHQQANHPFIHVAVPAGPSTFWNQNFAPN